MNCFLNELLAVS